ncbi:O-antigen ligase family protein [Pseudonocardia sp.]|uniref:O-antigen ligase family protein n=1 Tax=Pseudonocardia sp. TaxID=60912 RepID=UPI003D0B02FE
MTIAPALRRLRPETPLLRIRQESLREGFFGVLLCTMVLAVAISPRLRLGEAADKAVDARLQDFLFLICFAFLASSLPSLVATWGSWFVWWLVGAATVTTLHLFDPAVSPLRAVAFLGRAVEPFVIAIVVAALYLRAGPRAGPWALRAMHLGVLLNSAWVVYQLIVGKPQTLLGEAVSSVTQSYGPMLIGEPSSLGAGFYFAVVAALGAAEFRTKMRSRPFAVAMMVIGFAGTFVTQSRVSLVAAAVCVVFLAARPTLDRGRKPILVVVLLVVFGALVALLPNAGRLSTEGAESGVSDRIDLIWSPLLRIVHDQFLIGIGPGQLGTPEYPWTEAHNIVLRAVLDYGLLVGGLFIAIFVTVYVRSRRVAADRDASLTTRFWATLAGFVLIAVAVAGSVQDALTAVTSTHLVVVMIGLFAGAQLAEKRTAATVDRRRQLVESRNVPLS